jgi:proline iminopeptidase
MPRGDLFPEIGPFETGYMPLTDGHVMYWEQVGNPRGAPVLFLHGGPGAGAGTVHRRFFDPAHWRVVIFDQRGAGRSRPLGSLAANTTSDLVADIETLRRHLGIERFLLFGGSWGSTLALAYAQAHPERVSACVLRGVFLGRPVEVEWFLHGIATLFPAGARAGRPAGQLSPPPDRSRSDGAFGCSPRLVRLRRLVQHPAAQPGHGLLVRPGPDRAGVGAD